jgi:hypothetical protein
MYFLFQYTEEISISGREPEFPYKFFYFSGVFPFHYIWKINNMTNLNVKASQKTRRCFRNADSWLLLCFYSLQLKREHISYWMHYFIALLFPFGQNSLKWMLPNDDTHSEFVCTPKPTDRYQLKKQQEHKVTETSTRTKESNQEKS